MILRAQLTDCNLQICFAVQFYANHPSAEHKDAAADCQEFIKLLNIVLDDAKARYKQCKKKAGKEDDSEDDGEGNGTEGGTNTCGSTNTGGTNTGNNTGGNDGTNTGTGSNTNCINSKLCGLTIYTISINSHLPINSDIVSTQFDSNNCKNTLHLS